LGGLKGVKGVKEVKGVKDDSLFSLVVPFRSAK
jgi:hypothetical protein